MLEAPASAVNSPMHTVVLLTFVIVYVDKCDFNVQVQNNVETIKIHNACGIIVAAAVDVVGTDSASTSCYDDFRMLV